MASISFEFLFKPAEDIDTWLTGLFDGAPLLVALAIAFLLGLRHASDPDHLVAVTSLVAAEDGDTRAAARLGAWWGLGHAAMLVVIGIPLIAFKSELPVWLESGAEKAIGLVIVVLALRVIWKWFRGDFRAGRHAHPEPEGAHSHLRPAQPREHGHRPVRTPRQAFFDRRPARDRRHRGRRPAAAGGAADEARGGARAGRVRADVDRLDGALHHRLRLGPDQADRRAGLPQRPDPGDRPLRGHLRGLVHGPRLTAVIPPGPRRGRIPRAARPRSPGPG